MKINFIEQPDGVTFVDMEDEEESGAAHELREIEPNTWSNGHLRFDPQENGWTMRPARAPRDGVVRGRIRWNPVWKEYVLRPNSDCVLAHDCLADISALLQILTARRTGAVIAHGRR